MTTRPPAPIINFLPSGDLSLRNSPFVMKVFMCRQVVGRYERWARQARKGNQIATRHMERWSPRFQECEQLLRERNAQPIKQVFDRIAAEQKAERAALFKLRLALKKQNLKTADLPGLSASRLRQVATVVAADLSRQGMQVDDDALLENLTQMAQGAKASP